jgi:D-alanine-D-alanine ligase
MKKTVCMLYGGKSGEHEVSKQSAASILKYINKDKYRIIPIGIKKDGTWHVQEEPLIENDPQRGDCLAITKNNNPVTLIPEAGILYLGQNLGIDIIIPVLHGTFGEDGTMQGFFEILNIPYVGAGVLGSALAMDKEKVKVQWRAEGLPVLDYLIVRKHEYPVLKQNPQDLINRLRENKLTYPLFIKPAAMGSSVGVEKVDKETDLFSSLEKAFVYDRKVLIEQGITAREIECAVLGNDSPEAFAPGEVIPHHSFYSYKAKYLDPDGASVQIPAALPEHIREKVKKYAVHAYTSAEVTGMARVDLFYEEKSGNLYLNEINTIPGFTNISMFPSLCAHGGLAYTELIDNLIELGFERSTQKRGLVYSLNE